MSQLEYCLTSVLLRAAAAPFARRPEQKRLPPFSNRSASAARTPARAIRDKKNKGAAHPPAPGRRLAPGPGKHEAKTKMGNILLIRFEQGFD